MDQPSKPEEWPSKRDRFLLSLIGVVDNWMGGAAIFFGLIYVLIGLYSSEPMETFAGVQWFGGGWCFRASAFRLVIRQTRRHFRASIWLHVAAAILLVGAAWAHGYFEFVAEFIAAPKFNALELMLPIFQLSVVLYAVVGFFLMLYLGKTVSFHETGAEFGESSTAIASSESSHRK